MTATRQRLALAGVAAFVAWGLMVQWLPVLRFLGYAFNLGLFTAPALLLLLILTNSRSGPADAYWTHDAVPAMLLPPTWRREKKKALATRDYTPVQLYTDSFVVAQALDGLLSVALRDLIASWYTNITQSPTFVNEVDREIRFALLRLFEKLQREDVVALLVSRVVPIVTTHFRLFDQAEKAVRGKSLRRNVTESDELDLAIAAKYKDGRLHPAASLAYSATKSIQQEHLRKVMMRVLPDLVSENMIRSRAVFVLVREIVACAVLYPVTQMLSDSDTWNQTIEAYGRAALQDRKSVRRMRAALDAHTSPVPKRKSPAELPRLAPNDSERAFERFVRAIRRVKTLSDARRFRSQVASQLTKESLSEGQDPVYLRRLEMAKRVLEQKIARLSHPEPASMQLSEAPEPREEKLARAREMTLPEIMHTAAGLSYFMEFMDRRQMMLKVQFWIVVDGFRNPLEDDFGDDGVGSSNQSWTDTDRLDIAQISEAYVSKPELNVPQESLDIIAVFLVAGRRATSEQYRAARTAILSAQSVILADLEANHLPQFRKSDLYFKFLASDEANARGLRQHLNLDFDTSVTSASSRAQAAPMVRSSSQPAPKAHELRRAALSSGDIRALTPGKRAADGDILSRTSIDSEDRPPLFDDGYDTDPLAHSSLSNRPESLDGDNTQPNEVIESMEAALTNIIADKPRNDIHADDPEGVFGPMSSEQRASRPIRPSRLSSEVQRSDSASADKPKPSLATLGLVNMASRIGVFSDNDLFPDEEKFIEDEYVDQDQEKANPEDEVQPAAPGDLGLAEAITALTTDIERLVSQEAVVDTLTRKAELTNNVTELRILGKSRSSLQREIRRKELQRQQYIVQESDNSLYGRSSIRIKSVMVGREDDGREYALYVIEVQKSAGDQMPAATWAIARRYSEFHELHQSLRRRYPSTRTLEFPRRRMVMKLQKQFLQNRRLALESYLQLLLNMPDVCRSRELRSFLSQQAIVSNEPDNTTNNTQDLVTRIYNSVTDGMDEFLGNIAVIDQLSVAGQNLISAATAGGQAIDSGQEGHVMSMPQGQGSVAEAEAELRAFEMGEEKEMEPFVKPICDIFLEIFELNKSNNWLRGRAVVVVLQQLLGGTIERKIRDSFKSLFQEDNLTRTIDGIRESIWPTDLHGHRKTATLRTKAEKEKSEKDAKIMLASLIPDLAGSVVGRTNAQAASRRIIATLNNQRLNEHLVLTILDDLVGVLFGGLGGTGTNTGSSLGAGVGAGVNSAGAST